MTTEADTRKKTGSGVNTYLLVPIFLFFALLIFAVIRSPSLISPAGIGSAIIVVAPLVLATYALTVIVMAGRGSVDLSIGPLLGFVNVSLIQLSGAGAIQSPIATFLFAMGVGVAYQLLMGLIVVFVRVQPIIVSLSGYLSLVGLNLVILPRPGGLAPEWMLSWGAGTTIFSPILVILILATIGWYILAQTSFWGHLKFMGADERAAYTSGIQINIVRIGAHMIGGVYAGLAALTFTSLISSGDPTQGTTYTLMAVTALVLGGANLAGGRGGALGSLLGALNIYLVTYVLATFNFGTLQSFVTDLAFGLMLVVSLLISLFVPELQRRVRGLSPLIFFILMSIPALGVIIHRTRDQAASDQLLPASTFSTLTTSSEMAAESTGTGGAIFLISVIGIVAILALVRLFIRMRNLTAVGFAAVLIAIAFGMLFSGPGEDAQTAETEMAQALGALETETARGFFAVEAAVTEKADTFTGLALSGFAVSVIWMSVAVLLTSFVVIVALPQFSVRAKKISLWWFAVATSAAGLLTVLFPSVTGGTNLLSGLSDYHIALLVGVVLFVMSGPLVQAPLRNISQLFIIALSVSAVVAVLLFSATAGDREQETSVQFAAPVLGAPEIQRPRPETYPAPKRMVHSEQTAPAIVSQLSFSLLLIVLVQYFVGRAMGPTSFRNFWPYAPITAMCLMAGGGMLFVIGVPLWKILAALIVGIPSTPLVLHIVKTYRKRRGSYGSAGATWNSFDSLREEKTA